MLKGLDAGTVIWINHSCLCLLICHEISGSDTICRYYLDGGVGVVGSQSTRICHLKDACHMGYS